MIGQTISHYEILTELGAGGMGVVYKARDTDLNRLVALKFLSDVKVNDDHSSDRFMIEARAAAKLDHPNICTIYEVGQTSDGQPFIAMAHYEGQELSEAITEGSLQEEDIRSIVKQIALGLGVAHQAGIVHRDVKPGNIILTDDGVVKILDFGLAKDSSQVTITAEGTTLGTVAYMSPEQADSRKLNHKSDIWSLGVILYEMLSGRRPFESPYPQATLYAILNSEPDPLPEDAPEDLRQVVAGCLQKDPEDRFGTCLEILETVGALSVEIRSALAPPRQHSWVTKALSIVVTLLIGILIWQFTGSTSSVDEHPVLLILPFTDVSETGDQSRLASSFSLDLPSRITAGAELSVLNRNTARYFGANPTPTNRIRQEFDVDFIVDGRLSRDNDNLVILVEITDAETSVAIWEETYRRPHADLYDLNRQIAADIVNELGAEAFSTTDSYNAHPEAYETYLRGIELMDEQHDDSLLMALDMFGAAIELDSLWAKPHAGYARAMTILWERNLTDTSMNERGIERAEAAMQKDSLYAEAWLVKSWVDQFNSRPADELASLNRAVELDPSLAVAHMWLAGFYTVYIDREAGMDELHQSLRLDPKNLQQLLNLADISMYDADWDQARETIATMRNIDSLFYILPELDLALLAHEGQIEPVQELLQSMNPENNMLTQASINVGMLRFWWLTENPDELNKAVEAIPDSLLTYVDRFLAATFQGNLDEAFELADDIDFGDFHNYWNIQMVAPNALILDPRWRAIQENLGYGPSLLN